MLIKKKYKIVIILFIFAFIFIYTLGTPTYTSYEQEIKTNSLVPVAKWNITVNKINIMDYFDKNLEINDITWENNSTKDNKLAPGSRGKAKIVISPNDTEVAIKYDLKFIDKTVDSSKVLTIINISDDDGDLIKSSDDTYTGFFLLDDIKKGKTKTLIIDLEWIDNEENDEFDTKVGMGEISAEFLTISMTASQYDEK